MKAHHRVVITSTDLDTGETSEVTFHRVESFDVDLEPVMREPEIGLELEYGPVVAWVEAVRLEVTGRAVPKSGDDREIAVYRRALEPNTGPTAG